MQRRYHLLCFLNTRSMEKLLILHSLCTECRQKKWWWFPSMRSVENIFIFFVHDRNAKKNLISFLSARNPERNMNLLSKCARRGQSFDFPLLAYAGFKFSFCVYRLSRRHCCLQTFLVCLVPRSHFCFSKLHVVKIGFSNPCISMFRCFIGKLEKKPKTIM